MKNEPDNRTKQWLQAYAHKRREQAGQEVELHEATRRMLLDESKREWSETAAPEPESAPAKLSWFSWAWIGSVAAGVMLVAVISKNGSQGDPADPPVEMTKNIPGTGDGNVEDQKRASTSPADEAILGGKKDRVGDLDTASAVAEVTSLPTDVAPSAPRPAALRGIEDAGGGAPGSAPATFSGARLAKTSQAMPKVQASANFYSSPERLRQDFAPNTRRTVTRSAARVVNTKALEPVMQNFQFERVGINVLVVDHDGSEYRGTVRALEKADLAGRDLPADKENVEKDKAARGQNPVPPARLGSSTATGFSFQVTGTNRTLNQRVVFEGNILNEQAMKLKPSVRLLAVKGPGEAKKQLAEPKKTEALPRLRIQGHAQVGELQYGVDARNVPSPRPAKAASPEKLGKDGPPPKK
jgi:hypothetical protein